MKLDEAKKVLIENGYGYSVEKDIDSAINALAEYLSVSPENITESSEDYESYEPDYVLEINIRKLKQIYLVYNDENSAKEAAIDDLGEDFRYNETKLGGSIKYFKFNAFKKYINGLNNKEMKKVASIAESLPEDELGIFIQKQVASYGGIDYRGWAEYNIKKLGNAWHLADFDGKEIKLNNGMVAYRVD